MPDSKPAVDAATNDPAEVTKTEESVEVMPDAKSEAPAEVAKVEAAENANMENSNEVANGSAEAVKTMESSADKREEKATNGASANGDRKEKEKENGNRYKDSRNSKYDRGDKRNGGSKYDKNNRSRRDEYEGLPETDDPVEIRAQVEFYFSTQNLCTDEHLFLELDGPNNRPVPIKHISQFKRMRRFQPYSAIVSALRDSEDLIVVDEGEYSGIGNEAVKRKEPIAVPRKEEDEKDPPDTKELFRRLLKSAVNNLDASIYVKGFGDENQAGQIALEQFFKPYGSVMVRKRRDDYKNWKGSVFVEFDSIDSQQQFLALDPKPKYNGNELTIMSKKAYSEMKCKEKGITPAWLLDEEYTSARGGHRGGRGGARGRGRSRGGRYNNRSDRRDYRDRRGRQGSRSRSPRRRRDRSDSRSSEDPKHWNGRRDRFQKSKEFRSDKRDNHQRRKSIERDPHGVPIVRDTRTEAEKAKSNKRKTDDSDREDSAKRAKIQIKEDE